jgi:hypothetical protein
MKTKRPYSGRWAILASLTGALLAALPQAAAAESPSWTATVQGGISNNFQLTLGGAFGDGPDFYNRATVTVNNALRQGDGLSLFGWSTTDLPTSQPNWQAGLMYKTRVLNRGRHNLTLGGGVQRWVFPLVKTGAKDWLVAGNLVYATKVRRVPVVVTSDSYSLLASTLAKGSAVYTQIYTEHKLYSRPGMQLAFREGPAHTYAWGFYGAQGNRVVRYGGSLILSMRGTVIDAGYRQQFGLQDGIKYNHYWSFGVTRLLAHGSFKTQ